MIAKDPCINAAAVNAATSAMLLLVGWALKIALFTAEDINIAGSLKMTHLNKPVNADQKPIMIDCIIMFPKTPFTRKGETSRAKIDPKTVPSSRVYKKRQLVILNISVYLNIRSYFADGDSGPQTTARIGQDKTYRQSNPWPNRERYDQGYIPPTG